MKPPPLRPGDTVGVVSPSWGGAGLFPHRVENGVAQLESMGFSVRLGAHALGTGGFVSDTAENRVADLHAMFLDSDVRAVIAAIGGDHSCHLLPHLDFELIRRHPTIFMGYSDVTVLNLAIWVETGLTTFNGPTLLTDFAEHPRMFEYTEHAIVRTLCTPEPAGLLEPSPWWTEELLDWHTRADLARPRTREPSPGWAWLRNGRAEGLLIGGCISSLQHLRGTTWWPDLEGTLLFLETAEDKPSLATVDGMLMDYENMGVFEQIRGLLVGRPMYYSAQEKLELHQVLLDRTRRYAFPIVADMDFGHTAPQLVLPIGCRARIDADSRRFEILEAAVG